MSKTIRSSIPSRLAAVLVRLVHITQTTAKSVSWILLVFLGVWILYGIFAVVVDGQRAGQFGDTFGALNALVSGLAMLGVVGAILLQRQQISMQAEELKLQRLELELTRAELQGQKDALMAQNELTRKANVHRVLVDILYEYRSVEMLAAIRSLWQLARDHPTDLTEAYEAQRIIDAEQVDKFPPDERLDAEGATLHFKRRLVSQFYQLLSGLYELGLVHEDVLFTYWSEGDLRIIPHVIIPIEVSLAANLGTASKQPSPTLARLQRLYDDCCACTGPQAQ